MPRPRKYIVDPRTNQQVDGLSYHRSSRQYYSITDGERNHWGNEIVNAIDSYLASLSASFSRLDDRAAIDVLKRQGKKATPNAVESIKRDYWLYAGQILPMKTEANAPPFPLLEEPAHEAAPRVNPDGIRTLSQAGDQWAAEKQGQITRRSILDCLRHWQELVTFAARRNVKDIAQIDKDFLRKYRSHVQARGKGSAHFHSARFRSIKAVLRHTLKENDVAGMDEQQAAYLMMSLSMLRAKATKAATNRYLSKQELHILLAHCTKLADTDVDSISRRIKGLEHGSKLFQLAASQLGRAQDTVFFGIQFRALYLTAVNCMFDPIDIATIPTAAVTLKNGHVHFRRCKTDTIRAGLLLPTTLKAIKEWMAIRTDGSDKLFVNSLGTKWDTKSLGRHLKKHRETLGLSDDLTLKAFRKGGYAAALQDDLVDVYTAKILAGHPTGITESYVDAAPGRCRRAVKSIGKVYDLS